jgi:IS5 family transposase
MMQSSLFDLEKRHRKLDKKDPLIQLNQLIDWESFRPLLNPIRSKKKKVTLVESLTIQY